jgi:hypothetical protein
MRYIAGAVSEWAGGLVGERGRLPESCDVALAAWALGPLVFGVIAAEVFVETAIELQHTFPERIVTTVGYGSPLIGYLPTDDALREGGYEVAEAYRFYGHPAAFASGSEPAVRRALESAIRSLTRRR